MKIIKFLLIALAAISFGCEEEEASFDNVAQLAEDLQAIDKYINDNNLTSDTLHHWTGIRYIINEKGSGIRAKEGDQIEVEYEGRFLTDEIFDSGVFGDDPPIVLNLVSMIPGWYFMCQEMDEGDKFTIFLPSQFGYGQRGSGNSIPPNTPLIFDMKMLKVGE